MTGKEFSALAALLAASSIGWTTAAFAQSALGLPATGPGTPVVIESNSNQSAGGPTAWNASQEITALSGDRMLDPYYLAKGIPMGAFRLFPDLIVDGSYDDNVYRVHSGAQSDFFVTEMPTLDLNYQTSSAQLDIYGDGTLNQYTKLSAVDNDEYDVGAKGGYIISRAVTVSGNVSYSQLAEALSSPDTVGFQARPNLYNLFDASGQVSIKPNRLGFTFGGSDNSYRYTNTPLLGGGTLDNNDRNNSVYSGFAQSSYEFSPGYSVYIRGNYNSDSFEEALDRTGTRRDSHGYQADAGINLLLGDLIQGTVYLGYIDQFYDRHQVHPLSDIAGLDFGAGLTWYPTELLKVQLTASRQIENTTLAGASGGDDRNVLLSATYEATRRVLLTANVGYDDTDFKGSVPYQDDRTPTAGLGLKFLLSHYVQLQANYQYTTRDSALGGLKYNDNLVSVGVNLQI